MDSVAIPVIEKYSLFNNLDNLYYKQQLLEFFSQEQPNSIFSELIFHTGILGVTFLSCIFIKLIKNDIFGKKFIVLVFFVLNAKLSVAVSDSMVIISIKK